MTPTTAPIFIRHRPHPAAAWVTLGFVGTLAAAERWVGLLARRHPGEWQAGPIRIEYRPGRRLTRTESTP